MRQRARPRVRRVTPSTRRPPAHRARRTEGRRRSRRRGDTSGRRARSRRQTRWCRPQPRCRRDKAGPVGRTMRRAHARRRCPRAASRNGQRAGRSTNSQQQTRGRRPRSAGRPQSPPWWRRRFRPGLARALDELHPRRQPQSFRRPASAGGHHRDGGDNADRTWVHSFGVAEICRRRRTGTRDQLNRHLGADLDHAAGWNLEIVGGVVRGAGKADEQPVLPARHAGVHGRFKGASRQEE